MSLEAIKDQAVQLLPAEQRELIAFLISRQRAQDEEFQRKLARKIDDNEPSHWMDLDAVQRRFAE